MVAFLVNSQGFNREWSRLNCNREADNKNYVQKRGLAIFKVVLTSQSLFIFGIAVR